MKLERVRNHIALNADAIKQLSKNSVNKKSFFFLPRDVLDRISTMENKAIGYVYRFGDKAMLTKFLKEQEKDTSHNYLLLKLGIAIDKKENVFKALNFIGEKNNSEDLELKNIQKEAEKEIKQALLNIDLYYLGKRLSGESNVDVAQSFNEKVSVVNNSLVNKNAIPLKIKMGFIVRLQNELLKKSTVNEPKKENLEYTEGLELGLENDFDFDLEQTERYSDYLSFDSIEQQIELKARRDFYLKEVTSNIKVTSLDGDIPRAVITDLSFGAINTIVDDMNQRFTKTNPTKFREQSKKPVKKNDSVKATTSFYLKMKKPTPEIVNNFSKVNQKKLRDFEAMKAAKQRTLQISKMFMFSQQNHMNYIDVERFELDKIQDRSSIYESGARNPLSGRIISSKIKNMNSDLRNDSTYKPRK